MIKLSIIIPYYNTLEYTNDLLKGLQKQITEECEIILVDDGSKVPFSEREGIKVFRQNNKGVSAARNKGLKEANGKYIVFVDSDDRVSDNYIQQIFKAIESDPDTVYLSWKSMDGKFGKTIRNQNDKFGPYNRCVWNRVFKKTYIKGLKFDENMPVAEDDDFLKRLPEAKSHTFVSEPIYFYRVGRIDGLSMRKANGEFEAPDVITQVVLYYSWVQEIGGVETFFYNFCKKMSEFYDIVILYDRCDAAQVRRLCEFVPCYPSGYLRIMCDTLIINGILDKIPQKVTAKCKIRLIHTCKIEKYGILSVPDDCDRKIFVSDAARKSFNEKGMVIPNIPGDCNEEKDSYVDEIFKDIDSKLVLISATRLTNEKGYDRMLKLANRFRNLKIPFIWLVFTAHNNKSFPEGFVKFTPTLNIKPYIAKADYLVQLSDIEAYCYSLQEALQLKVPVLTTPFEAIKEVGVKDGKNGYILPFNIDELTDNDIQKIYSKIPKCQEYEDKTEAIIKQWREVLGDTVPTHSYKYGKSGVLIRCLCPNFRDLRLNKNFKKGDFQFVDKKRAKYLVEKLNKELKVKQQIWEYV